MTEIRPVNFLWDGDAMTPDPRFRALCERQFVVGQTYPLIPMELRSRVSHAHFFASLNEAWHSLPEQLHAKYPTVDHLRAKALVEVGYADEHNYVCDTPTEAKKMAAFVRKIDTYAVIKISGNVVRVFHAKSQDTSAMDRQAFQDSKTKVLDFVAGLIGTTPSALDKEGKHQGNRA